MCQNFLNLLVSTNFEQKPLSSSQMNILRSSGDTRLNFMGLANMAMTPTEFFASMNGSRCTLKTIS
uniref:Methyl-CpG binding domain 4, DNA glycosylase n=1 Tax=Molossus molossus TaxID=27622 RepID=A0A7J8DC33_MOLMO|nr:methyl-CpG binding domain 4, DNA glycosylase [Molossus molossus]